VATVSAGPERPLRFERPSIVESMGLSPLRERGRQALIALRGDDDVPPSRYDRSSLKLLDPRLSIPLWRGRYAVDRQVVLTNLFNHRQTPIERGWSVQRTQVEDFRGGKSTYDSHNGTDFCVPRGTPMLAPASGRVVRVVSEFHRGGLKLAIDHGGGLITSSAHLARVLVREGEVVARGQYVAVTGYSGLDSLVTFPWGIPHIHFNVWLDGQPVDPFARRSRPDEVSLFVNAKPTPIAPHTAAEAAQDSTYDPARVDQILARCITPSVRERLEAIEPLGLRAARTIFEMNYFPTRFPDRASPLDREHARTQRLHLPFSAEHFDGAVFADEL
jgi:murein DD-endopeptidase MepM/ murein hydrolase activator NlpD